MLYDIGEADSTAHAHTPNISSKYYLRNYTNCVRKTTTFSLVNGTVLHSVRGMCSVTCHTAQ